MKTALLSMLVACGEDPSETGDSSETGGTLASSARVLWVPCPEGEEASVRLPEEGIVTGVLSCYRIDDGGISCKSQEIQWTEWELEDGQTLRVTDCVRGRTIGFTWIPGGAEALGFED